MTRFECEILLKEDTRSVASNGCIYLLRESSNENVSNQRLRITVYITYHI